MPERGLFFSCGCAERNASSEGKMPKSGAVRRRKNLVVRAYSWV